MKTPINYKKNGLTLIELMVVLLVAMVLTKVAYASYTGFQIRENREVAKHQLMVAATAMEKYYAQNGRYTTSDGGWPTGLFASDVHGSNGVVYTLQMASGNPNAQDFKILAVPKSGTIQGSDGDICIDKGGKFMWPTNGNCVVVDPSADVPVPTSTPSATPSVNPSPYSSPSPSVAPSPSSSPSPSPSPSVIPSPSPSPLPSLNITGWCKGKAPVSVTHIHAGSCSWSFDCQDAVVGGACSGGTLWPYNGGGSCSGSCVDGSCSGDCRNAVIRGACDGDCTGSRVYGSCSGAGC